MKNFQILLLSLVVFFLVTTSSAYKFSSKHDNHSHNQGIQLDDHIKKNNNIYRKTKDATVKIGSFKKSNNAVAKSSRKTNFSKKKRNFSEYEDCESLVYSIDSYLKSDIFDSKALCGSDLKKHMRNIKRYQDCYEDNLGYELEAKIYSHCMVDSNGNLCPLSRLINKRKDFKLSPSIENYKMNCISEKCRLDSIKLNKSQLESLGEEITYLDVEAFEEVEEFLNSRECLSKTIS